MADDDAPGGGPTAQLMRQALLRELARAPGDASAPATTLEQITRKLLAKAGEGELAAIKEIYDRVDGKTVSATAALEDGPKPRLLKWMD
jgi:hypothetical protein